MGKSNRIRANRAGREVLSLNTKQKKGMPSWMITVIAIVLTLAIVLSVVGLLLSSNGVFNRWATALSTEHFKVNANMLSYYYYTQYQTFLNENSSQLSMYSLDPSKSLKTQRFGGPETTEEATFYYDVMLGDFEGTWFDYFMDQTVTSVSSLLVYCEGAYSLGIELDEKDHEQIDANLTALLTSAPSYYANSDAYISAVYGQGVKEKDIRKAMEYSALATKYMSEASAKISDEITDEDVDEAYAADPRKFLLVDYSYYTFSVTYADAKKEAELADVADSELTAEQKETIAEKYQELIDEAKDDAKALQDETSLEAVNDRILTLLIADAVDTAWSQQTISVEDEAAVKDAVIALVKANILANDDEASAVEDDDTLEAMDLGETVLGQLETVKNSAFTEAMSDRSIYLCEKANYVSDEDEVSDWAFSDTAKNGDKTLIVDGDEDADVTSASTYSISAYYLAKAPYRDTEQTKNVAYMLFTDENAAKAVVQAMMDGKVSTLEEFEALVEEYTPDAHTSLEDYVKGSLQSDLFDEWLYSEDTVVGTYTEAPLLLEDSSTYCVALYYGEGHEAWYVSVKNQILTERFDEKVAELNETFEVTVKEKALDRVDA